MHRRSFLQSALALAGTAALGRGQALAFPPYSYLPPPQPDVKRVLVMYKCHFDAGFIDTQKAVVDWYFSDYFPQAIRTAEDMRRTGGPPYVWTTGSWLLYEYLEQASAADRRRMENAIAVGDIAWHALPFNWQTEVMDPSVIAASIGLSHSLDKRFGKTTTGAKMTDVPGHTCGLITPIAAQGVKFLDIGVNGGCTVPGVPPVFVWKDTRGASLIMMYHHGYSGLVPIPGSNVVVAIMVRGDNSGPHTPNEIVSMHAEMRHRYPNATIEATSLTGIANAIEPYRGHLPVVTQEIGDTWIYGIPSDPLKLARYRELARLRQQWIAQGNLHAGDATDIALLRHVLLEPEHTWGTDTKTWLDFTNYTSAQLSKVLGEKNYKVVEFSWEEKRKDLFDGVATLPAPLRSQAEEAIRNLDARPPQMPQGKAVRAGEEIETQHFIVKLDSTTGAIHRLRRKHSGREWASPDHPLALFSYQTLSQEDYARFLAAYTVIHAEWLQCDLGKPNIANYGAKSQEWVPTVVAMHAERGAQGHRVLVEMEIRDAEAQQSGRTAFPSKMYLELFLPDAEPEVQLNFFWFQKPAMRLPESLWLTFNPIVSNPQGWTMDKSGEPVSPFDVVAGGSRHMHAVTRHVTYADDKGAFVVEPLDAPVIAVGGKSPLNYSREQPDLSDGIHSNLFNNAWGTNYIMWYGGDMRFRYRLRA